jgi:PleD family two-component response regulator
MPGTQSGKSRLRVIKSAPATKCRPSATRCDLRLISPDDRSDHRRVILFACHQRAVRQSLVAALLRQGCRIVWCDNGDTAMRYLASERPDLVITGMMMPNRDGLELIRGVRGLYPALPIMALAEEWDPMSRAYLRYAVLSGAASAHTAPVNIATFLADLEHILGNGARAIQTAV